VASKELFAKLFTRRVAIRHIGVSVTNLDADRRQNELFDTGRKPPLLSESRSGPCAWAATAGNAVFYGKGLERASITPRRKTVWFSPPRVFHDNILLFIQFVILLAFMGDTIFGADGRVVRDSGKWAEEKLYYLGRYLKIMSVGMSKKWAGKLYYVDLFAGPGRCQIRETRKEIDGSPLIALLGFNFNKYFFFEGKPGLPSALEERVRQDLSKNTRRSRSFMVIATLCLISSFTYRWTWIGFYRSNGNFAAIL